MLMMAALVAVYFYYPTKFITDFCEALKDD